MKRHVLTVLAFVVATFGTQAPSHFVIFADHYAEVTYIRKETLFQFGVLAMLIQGVVLSVLYARFDGGKSMTKSALGFSWLMGAFLVSYSAFAEAAKYMVSSVASWIAVELAVGSVQFTLFGLLLGLIYRERTERGAGATGRAAHEGARPSM
jgi:hypothetical protein